MELEDDNINCFKECDASANVAIKHVNMIMPLMFEAWIEFKESEKILENNSISNENGIVLKLIMNIILELYTMIESNEAPTKHSNNFLGNIKINSRKRFPLTQNENKKFK